MTNIIDPPDPDTNNQYNWALWLAQELGVKVFPVDHPGSKTCQGLHEHEPEANNPLTCTDRGKVAAYAFTKKATNKVDTITAWWTGGLYNVGVYMSGSGLIVIDEDLLDALAKYAADNGKEIPITFTVSTAKGRHHYFYDTENGTFGNHEGALAEYGINVRSGNAYVVGPGSMHVSGTVYEVEILAPIVPLPTWIRDAIRAKPNGHKDEPADSSNGFNGFELPKVIRGDRPDRPGERDNVLFAFASSLRAQSINYATAKLMMEMAWSRCEQPPIAHTAFTWDKALAKLDNAYQYPPGRSDGYEPRNGENETEAEDEDDSWTPVDLGAVLDGTFERVQATIGHRNDDVAVLYPGKEHSVIGEPETGKGWLLLHVAADEITRGGRVLYIDFEDDEGTVVGRLHRELGVPADDIKARFFYVRPDSPGIQRYGRLLETTDPALVVLDGVTEGYGLHGWQIKENDDSPKWRTAFVKPAMRRGAATLSTDHVVKNGEARNGYAIGGQHKKAGLTGVLFELINVQPFGKGMRGKSKLVIHKDRNGDLRQHGIPDSKQPRIAHFADLYLDATGTDLKLELRPPNPPRDPGDSTG